MSNGITSISLGFDGLFGVGAIENIGRQATGLGMKKPLIVCDPNMVRLGIVGRVSDLLSKAGIGAEVYDQCVENPRIQDIDRGAAFFTTCGCDSLIAIGGGSPMDQAKVLGAVVRFGGSAADYNVLKGGAARIGRDMPPTIAVPTTSGTGSEATRAAVVTDPESKVKFVVISPFLRFSMAIVDPELTRSMPPKVTAATGFDVLVHAIESYVVKMYNPVADGMNRTSFELVGKSLKTAVSQGDNIEARSDMAMASLLAGIAFSMTGLGAVHALAHPLGAAFGVAHGLANSLMLPHVMRHNAVAVGARYVEATRHMGLKASTADAAAEAMTALARDVGLPTRLRDVGISEADLAQLAKDASRDVSLGRNPVPCTEADLLAMYQKAL
jgi:alcohol dehydrogenase class IV